MTKSGKNSEKEFLGDLPPLFAERSRRTLERRQISFRWLSGTVLTGLASVFLMGGALFAALDGRQQLAIPAQAYAKIDDSAGRDTAPAASKGPRLGFALDAGQPADNNIMMVSTVTREGDRDVVKTKPFLHMVTPLAIVPRQPVSYPAFDALAIFSENGEPPPVATSADLIYGADVEGEVTFTTEPFPYDSPQISLARRQSTEDIEETVRTTLPSLNIGSTALASISYFDPGRFSFQEDLIISSPDVTITAENVSTLSKTTREEYEGIIYEERLAKVRSDAPMALVLQGEGFGEAEALNIANALSSNLGSGDFQNDDRLRIFFEDDTKTGLRQLARISVYRGGTHLVSIAKNELGDYAYAQEPIAIPEVSQPSRSPQLLARSKLPSVYDAIYRASLNEGLTKKLTRDLIRIFAFDVDFRAAISRNDSLSVFMSMEDGADTPNENSEILYAYIRLGNVDRRYYRFLDEETRTVDYYDETGKSAKQFLLRQPVPNGTFRSPFGMRRHPITRVNKMHWGVDFSAPRGTPILAAGNGVVEKAGWAGGSGKRTILRHSNGYNTYYLHQTSFAKGIKPGARVRQGQVIGYVGSTGLSTGPHLHYEVSVNGNKVNPMKIKLPSGKVLRGSELLAFEAERDRIDALLKKREEENRVASLN